MPQYRGNVGNLLQHWVLCETVASCQNHIEHLAFIDAYSMAPFAADRYEQPGSTSRRAHLFDHVRDCLSGEQTPHEKAWHKLDPQAKNGSGYPNSAKFLTALWPAYYSLILCETDKLTVDGGVQVAWEALKPWVNQLRTSSSKCLCAEVFEGDWRSRFGQGLPVSGELVFLSFDPYMFNHNEVSEMKPGNMYVPDLDCIARAVNPISQGIIVQLSTYDANGDNSQQGVIEAIRSNLRPSDLEISALVRPLRNSGRKTSGQMMSVVLTRSISWADSLHSLELGFESWLGRAIKGASRRG